VVLLSLRHAIISLREAGADHLEGKKTQTRAEWIGQR